PLKPEARASYGAIRREFFSEHLTDGVEGRPSMDVLQQRVVDQRLVVSSTGPIAGRAKEFDHRVVEANGDLGLPWLGLHDGAPLGAGEIEVSIFLSDGPSHRLSSGACSPSTPKSTGSRRAPDTCKRRRAGSPVAQAQRHEPRLFSGSGILASERKVVLEDAHRFRKAHSVRAEVRFRLERIPFGPHQRSVWTFVLSDKSRVPRIGN